MSASPRFTSSLRMSKAFFNELKKLMGNRSK